MGDRRQNRGPAVVTTLARQLASDACRNCHRLLTAEELFYYLRRCEGCERAGKIEIAPVDKAKPGWLVKRNAKRQRARAG